MERYTGSLKSLNITKIIQIASVVLIIIGTGIWISNSIQKVGQGSFEDHMTIGAAKKAPKEIIQLDPYTIVGDGYTLKRGASSKYDLLIEVIGDRMHKVALEILVSKITKHGFTYTYIDIHLDKVTEDVIYLRVDIRDFIPLFDYCRTIGF